MSMNKRHALLLCRKAYNFKYQYNTDLCSKDTIHASCPFHGKFTVNTHRHMFCGESCPKCDAGDVITWKRFQTLIAKKLHKNLTIITPNSWSPFRPLGVKCKHHGRRNMFPSTLLNGKECPDCGKGIRSRKLFISDANKIHKNKFDYSKLPQGNIFGDIIIGCPVHGSIRMHSRAHIQGTGCRSCSDAYSKEVKKDKDGKVVSKATNYFWIYLFQINGHGKRFYKVGLTKDMAGREKQLRRGLADGYEIKLIDEAKFNTVMGAFKVEYYFLNTLPGRPVPKRIMQSGHSESKVNGLTPKDMIKLFQKAERWIRKNHKTYVSKRQVWNGEQRKKRKRINTRLGRR